jgi:hypothetical protein
MIIWVRDILNGNRSVNHILDMNIVSRQNVHAFGQEESHVSLVQDHSLM